MSGKKANKPAQAEDATNLTGLDTLNELLHNKRKLFWLNIQTGFVRGVAGVVGAAIAIVLIGFLVTKLGGLPYIGDFLQSLESATNQKSTQTQ